MAIFLLANRDSSLAFASYISKHRGDQAIANDVIAYLDSDDRAYIHAKNQPERATALVGTLPDSFSLPNFLCVPLSNTTSVCWALFDGIPVICDSRDALRQAIDCKLNKTRLALAVCQGVPMRLYNTSIWSEIRTVMPGCAVRFSGEREVAVQRFESPSILEVETVDEISALVHDALSKAICNSIKSGGSVTCDLSGGVDSTSLAFYLQAGGYKPRFFHSASDDPSNNDLYFALKAAKELGTDLEIIDSSTKIRSSFCPEYIGAPAAIGEGVPRWSGSDAHARNTYRAMSTSGRGVHITGLGGDELFDFHLAAPVDLIGRAPLSSPKQTWSAITNLRKLSAGNRWNTLEMMRVCAAQTSAEEELSNRIQNSRRFQSNTPANVLGWAPGFKIPSCLSSSARDLIAEEIYDTDSVALHKDRFRSLMLDSLMKQGELIRHLNASFGDESSSWSSPFLDISLINLVLALPTWSFIPQKNKFKYLLSLAAKDTVPGWVFQRSDKGDMSADLFADARRNLPNIKRLLKDGALVDHNVVDPVALNGLLSTPIHSTSQLMDLEDLANVEKWLRAVGAGC